MYLSNRDIKWLIECGKMSRPINLGDGRMGWRV